MVYVSERYVFTLVRGSTILRIVLAQLLPPKVIFLVILNMQYLNPKLISKMVWRSHTSPVCIDLCADQHLKIERAA